MQEISELALPRRKTDIEISAVTDGYVVYDPATDRVHYLNAVSSFILECSDGDTTAQEIARNLAEIFELAEPPISDVRTGLEQMRQEGLIEIL